MKTFYAIKHKYITLPEGVMVWCPTFSPDGKILFHDYNVGREYLVHEDGSGLKCVTDYADRPCFTGGFYYLLDNKRMFLSNELGDDAYILECEPSVYEAQSHHFYKIEFHDDVEGQYCIGRRTYHMAPDGKHLAYNKLTQIGLIMLVCEIVKEEERYICKNYKVVNPQGPVGAEDCNFKHWANGGTLTEFKSFTPDGKGFVFVALDEGGGIQQYFRNFRSGEIVRLTDYPDWNEDGSVSPDGEFDICYSWRTMGQLEIICTLPESLPLFSLMTGSVLAVNYVSSYEGFARDLQPWLLTADGSNDKCDVGQPLAIANDEIISGVHILGYPMWNRESNKVLLTERRLLNPEGNLNERVLEKGITPNRICIACIQKPGTAPLKPVETTIGDWAADLSEYRSSFQFQGEHRLDGKKGGYVNFTINGNLIKCDCCAEYHGYSNGGKAFLSGKESIRGSVADLKWMQDFTLTNGEGKRIGGTKLRLRFTKILPQPPRNIPPMQITGTAECDYNGKKFSGMPTVGERLECMQKKSPLILSAKLQSDGIIVTVKGNISGYVRPVCGAIVHCDGLNVCTDGSGIAKIKSLLTKTKIYVDAGDTFLPAELTIEEKTL